MNKCNHNAEYPVKHPNGDIYCLTCSKKLASTTFVGTESVLIPIRPAFWTSKRLAKYFEEQAEPRYLNLDKLATTKGDEL